MYLRSTWLICVLSEHYGSTTVIVTKCCAHPLHTNALLLSCIHQHYVCPLV